jgi:hypothetical protein
MRERENGHGVAPGAPGSVQIQESFVQGLGKRNVWDQDGGRGFGRGRKGMVDKTGGLFFNGRAACL